MGGRVTIIGAGNGGQTMAGDLGLRGFDVSLYDIDPGVIAAVADRGGVELIGERLSGFGRIRLATTNLARAVEGAAVIMVVVPAFAQSSVAHALAQFLADDQVVVLTPGYLGSLIFRATFEQLGVAARVLVAETFSLPYATRIVGPATVGIRAVKKLVHIAAYPANETPAVLQRMVELFPTVAAGTNVLEVALNNSNPMAHVATSLLNIGRIEAGEGAGGFDFHDWITPAIARINTALDEERLRVMRAMGLRPISQREWKGLVYGDAVKRPVKPMTPVRESSHSVPPRYIVEDVPMGLVPLESFGLLTGVPTKITTLLIDLAETVKESDYRATGRTLKALGLEGLTVEQVTDRLTYGSRPAKARANTQETLSGDRGGG